MTCCTSFFLFSLYVLLMCAYENNLGLKRSAWVVLYPCVGAMETPGGKVRDDPMGMSRGQRQGTAYPCEKEIKGE